MSEDRAAKPGAGVWDAAHRRLTFGLLLTISITAFEALAVATVLPETAVDLGGAAVTDVASGSGALSWYGWVFSGFMLANLVGIPAAGMLSDRGGPARPFVVGNVFFVIGLLVAGLASSMPLLVLGRVAQGFGAGALSSVAYVAVARGYAAADQPRMLALLASAWVIPGLLGPSAAAAIAAPFGWRSVFLLLVPMTAAAAWLSVAGMRDLGPAGSKSDDAKQMLPALQLAFGTGLAMFAAQFDELAVVFAGAALGVAVAAPALLRLLPAGTLRAAPGAPAALAAKGLVTFAFFGCEAFLPLSLTMVRGESIAVAGLALTAGTLCWTTGTWIQERLVTRVAPSLLVRGGLGLTALAVACAAFVLVAPSPALVGIASWSLAGLGIGLSYPTTTLIVFDLTPKGEEGSAASALQLANVLGVAFGTAVGGAILSVATASGATQAHAIAIIDAVMFVAALAGLFAAARSSATMGVRQVAAQNA